MGIFRTEPRRFEIRVHGVNNTAPADMLDVPPESIEMNAGDKLGSFWRSKPGTTPENPVAHGYVPKGVTREAYSWGGQVRTSPALGGSSLWGKIVTSFFRVAWALVLPFALSNATLWSSRLPLNRHDQAHLSLREGLSKVFGLCLTLLLTISVVTVSIDMVGMQCVELAKDTAAGAGRCTPLSGLIASYGLTQWTPGQRMALLSLVPALVLVGLWLLSILSRLRYDVETFAYADKRPDRATLSQSDEALLAMPGFWSNRHSGILTAMHITAGLALVSMMTAGNALIPGDYTSYPGLVPIAPSAEPWLWTTGYASAALLVIALLSVALFRTMFVTSQYRGRMWFGRITVTVAAIVFIVNDIALATPLSTGVTATDPSERMHGTGFVATILAALLLLIAISGIFWRKRPRGATRSTRRFEAWHGCAPAVWMMLALTTGLLISSALVITTGDWLNGDPSASALVPDPDHPAGQGLQIPPIYGNFGVIILVPVLVTILIAVAALLRSRAIDRRVDRWDPPARRDRRWAADSNEYPSGSRPALAPVLWPAVESGRGKAARLHLGEPIVGILTALVGVSLLGGLAVNIVSYFAHWTIAFSSIIVTVGMIAIAFIGLALLTALVASGLSGSGAARPLGVLWDIACFLPRTGHPFGPPCYAERAVPELSNRIHYLARRSDARVVVSAHSMGAVVSVAAIARIAGNALTTSELQRISFLTFGIQLRPYFGRMFPELLGPSVLGTLPCLRPALWQADPWRKDGATPWTDLAGGGPVDSAARLARSTLGRFFTPTGARGLVRWISLWRGTDLLGFPLYANRPVDPSSTATDGIDRYVEEIDNTGYLPTVEAHSFYFRTPQYAQALAELFR